MIFRSKARAAAVAVVAAMAGTALMAAPNASAATGQQVGYVTAYSDLYGTLYSTGGLYSGTLWNAPVGSDGTATTPSVTTVGVNAYGIAFEGYNNDLWIGGSIGQGDTGYPMKPGTSPAITTLGDGDWEIAFQDNLGQLEVIGSRPAEDDIDWGLPMDPKSSPSITPVGTTSFEVAYSTNTDALATAGADGTGVIAGRQVAPGTNPAITWLPNFAYAVAYQDSNGLDDLYAYHDSTLAAGAGWQMAAGTSPAIVEVPPTPNNSSVNVEIMFHAPDGRLWGDGGLGDGPIVDNQTGQADFRLAPGTSPAVVSVYLQAGLVGAGNLIPGYQVAFIDANYGEWVYEASPAFTPKYSLNEGNRHTLIGSGNVSASIASWNQ